MLLGSQVRPSEPSHRAKPSQWVEKGGRAKKCKQQTESVSLRSWVKAKREARQREMDSYG